MAAESDDLFKVTDRVDEAVQEIIGFYSVYNSMRYIRDRLVLRLSRNIQKTAAARFNAHDGQTLRGQPPAGIRRHGHLSRSSA